MTREFMRRNREEILNKCEFDGERMKIFDLLCDGYTVDEIADCVYLSTRTVSRRVSDICHKIDSVLK